MMKNLKSLYVGLMHGLGRPLKAIGFLAFLERRAKTSRLAHWLRSLFSIYDIDGMIALDVPWWTYAAIAKVDAHLAANPHAKIFEFGSGASTVWLARRATKVVSVEHHSAWHAHVTSCLQSMGLSDKSELMLVEPDEIPSRDPVYRSEKSGEKGQSFERYASAIDRHPDAPFDVIIIDGRVRAACLKHALGALAQDGMIVFDNSHRQRYQSAMRDSGLLQEKHRGLTPTLPYPDETTLLMRPQG